MFLWQCRVASNKDGSLLCLLRRAPRAIVVVVAYRVLTAYYYDRDVDTGMVLQDTIEEPLVRMQNGEVLIVVLRVEWAARDVVRVRVLGADYFSCLLRPVEEVIGPNYSLTFQRKHFRYVRNHHVK